MTDDELHHLEVAFRAARRHAEQAREARNIAVRAAIKEGWTHARVARVTGVSRGRVGQLATTRAPQ